MTEKPLDLREMKKKVDISNAKCIYCDKEVLPDANIGSIIICENGKWKVWVENEICTYWSCDTHGAVSAILHKEEIQMPSELVCKDFVRIDGNIFVNIKLIKSACEFYLKYKDNPELLAEEHPEYFSYIYKFEVVGDCKNVLVFKDILIDADQYNEWLFKLAFKPVFEDECAD